MWAAMAEYICRLAKVVLASSKRGGSRIKAAWWWNEEVKGKVKEKHDTYTDLTDSRMDEGVEVKRA